jgi:hypothetical protein
MMSTDKPNEPGRQSAYNGARRKVGSEQCVYPGFHTVAPSLALKAPRTFWIALGASGTRGFDSARDPTRTRISMTMDSKQMLDGAGPGFAAYCYLWVSGAYALCLQRSRRARPRASHFGPAVGDQTRSVRDAVGGYWWIPASGTREPRWAGQKAGVGLRVAADRLARVRAR